MYKCAHIVSLSRGSEFVGYDLCESLYFCSAKRRECVAPAILKFCFNVLDAAYLKAISVASLLGSRLKWESVKMKFI